MTEAVDPVSSEAKTLDKVKKMCVILGMRPGSPPACTMQARAPQVGEKEDEDEDAGCRCGDGFECYMRRRKRRMLVCSEWAVPLADNHVVNHSKSFSTENFPSLRL